MFGTLDGWDFSWSPSAAFANGAELEAEDPFMAEAAAFLTAVASGDSADIRCDLAEAMKTQRVVDAIAAALAQTGRQTVKGSGRAVREGFDAVEYS